MRLTFKHLTALSYLHYARSFLDAVGAWSPPQWRNSARGRDVGDPYLDGLATSVDGWSTIVPAGDPLRDALLFALLDATKHNKGVTVGRAELPITKSEVVDASPRALELLAYSSVADYRAAVRRPGFIFPADVAVVEQHVRTKSATAYDASLLRGDGSGYRRMRMQGWTFLVDLTAYRVVLLWPP